MIEIDRVIEFDPSTKTLHPSATGTNLALSGTLNVTGVTTLGVVNASGIVTATLGLKASTGLNVGSGAISQTLLNGVMRISNGTNGYIIFYDGSYRDGVYDALTHTFAISGTNKMAMSATDFSGSTDYVMDLGKTNKRFKYGYFVGLAVGGSTAPLDNTLRVGNSGGGIIEFSDTGYYAGHISGATLSFEIGGGEALKVLSTSDVRIINNKLFKARNAANNADLDLIGRNASDQLILGNALTGVAKLSSSVLTASTIVNADLSASADISPTKIKSHEFLAYVNASTSNDKTGDGTAYNIIFNSEAFDDSAAFNATTGVYTAPETGVYQFNVVIDCANVGAGHTQAFLNFVTSNRAIRGQQLNLGAIRDSGNAAAIVMVVMCDMDINDTAYMQIIVSNSTKTVGIIGNAGIAVSHISGGMVA